MLNTQVPVQLNVSRLLLLAQVADSGSITSAAAALSYSPSAVSQQLRKLEREAGQPLLDRHPGGVAINEAGWALVRHARAISAQLAAAQADLAEISGLRRGHLVVGTFRTVGSSFLPHAIRLFKLRYPEVDLRIESGQLDGLHEQLLSGVTDMALLWDYSWNPFQDDRIVAECLFVDPTVLLVADSHPLANERFVAMAQLADETWIGREEDSLVADVLDRSCHAAGFAPRVAVRSHDYQETQALVSVGLGIAMVPRTALAIRRPDIRAISLGDTAPSRRILLGARRSRVLAPAGNAMAAVMRAAVEQYLREEPTGGLFDSPGHGRV